jgi:hypothetical protein
MFEEVSELLIEAVMLGLYSLVVLATAGFGVLFEYRSLVFMNSGRTFLAIWLGLIGLVFITFSSHVVRDKLAGAYRELHTQRADQ